MSGKIKNYNLGLVLSGGGARGIAHLGVVEALYENGYIPEIISGTSAGSIVGVLLADGYKPKEILDIISFSASKFGLLKLTSPSISRESIMKMEGLQKLLNKKLRSKTFEELPIPLVVTATDIDKACSKHFTKGELIPAVIASSSIPVIFHPISIDGSRYVDGGVLNNLPVRCIRQQCETIIGIHTNPIEFTNKPLRGFFQIAERVFHMAIRCNIMEDKIMCDHFIEPETLSNYGIFDIDKLHDIYNIGYQDTIEYLKSLN